MTGQLASFRTQIDSSDWTITASSGGSLTAQTYNFYCQFKNRTGYNLFSQVKSVTVTNGQKLIWTIDSNAVKSGEDVFEFVLSCTTGAINTAKQIAKIKYRDIDQTTFRLLPLSLELTVDNDLNLLTVTGVGNLPTSPKNGKVVYVGNIAKYYEYDSEATEGDIASGGG
jgi:hypothetical protein